MKFLLLWAIASFHLPGNYCRLCDHSTAQWSIIIQGIPTNAVGGFPVKVFQRSELPRLKTASSLTLSGTAEAVLKQNSRQKSGRNAFEVRSPSNLCQGCFSFCSTSV